MSLSSILGGGFNFGGVPDNPDNPKYAFNTGKLKLIEKITGLHHFVN